VDETKLREKLRKEHSTVKLGLDLYGYIIMSENLRFAKQAGVTQIVAPIP